MARGWILFAALIHVVWAPVLLIAPEAAGATAIWRIVEICGSPQAASGVMAIAAGLAILGERQMTWHTRILLLMPQQIVLLISAFEAGYCAWIGVYADGTPINGAHIFADQWPYMLAAMLHVLAMAPTRLWD